jgi:hypothetical protein
MMVVKNPRPLQSLVMRDVLTSMKSSASQFCAMVMLLGFGGLPVFPGLGVRKIFKTVQDCKSVSGFLEEKLPFADEKRAEQYQDKLQDVECEMRRNVEQPAPQASFSQPSKDTLRKIRGSCFQSRLFPSIQIKPT